MVPWPVLEPNLVLEHRFISDRLTPSYYLVDREIEEAVISF